MTRSSARRGRAGGSRRVEDDRHGRIIGSGRHDHRARAFSPIERAFSFTRGVSLRARPASATDLVHRGPAIAAETTDSTSLASPSSALVADPLMTFTRIRDHRNRCGRARAGSARSETLAKVPGRENAFLRQRGLTFFPPFIRPPLSLSPPPPPPPPPLPALKSLTAAIKRKSSKPASPSVF